MLAGEKAAGPFPACLILIMTETHCKPPSQPWKGLPPFSPSSVSSIFKDARHVCLHGSVSVGRCRPVSSPMWTHTGARTWRAPVQGPHAWAGGARSVGRQRERVWGSGQQALAFAQARGRRSWTKAAAALGGGPSRPAVTSRGLFLLGSEERARSRGSPTDPGPVGRPPPLWPHLTTFTSFEQPQWGFGL